MKRVLSLAALILLLILNFSCQKYRPLYSTQQIEKKDYFRNWLLCGPFPNCSDCSRENYEHDERCKGFFTDYLVSIGGEALALPAGGTVVEVPALELKRRWFYYESETDKIPLNELFDPNDMVVAYAYCQIESPTPKKAILSVGSNDGIMIFLNGQKIHQNHVSRWLKPDNDFVPISLNAGINNLLLKIDEGTGNFGFVVRLLDYDSTLAQIRENLGHHRNLTLVSENDTLVTRFGTTFQIGTLNPGADARIEIHHEKIGKIGEQQAIPGTELRFLLTGIPDGFLTARAVFETPEDGAIISEKRHFKGKLKRHSRAGMLNAGLVPVSANGKPFLPIGTYGASPEDYELLKKTGYNFVVAGVNNLDKVQQAGLKAAVPIHGHKPHWFSAVRDSITKYKNHPAVLCWMLYDEPGYNRADLLDIYKIYQIAREADSFHPSYLVITTPTVYETHGRCCDILAIDTYPVSRGTIREVGKNIAAAYNVSDGDQPVWQCGQLFPWPKDRFPTPQENRFMTYYSFIEGAKGILWYTFRWQGRSLPDAAPELWQAHQTLLNELNQLAPLFLAQGFGKRVAPINESEAICARIKKCPLGRFLMVTNTSKTETIIPEFQLQNTPDGAVQVFSENRILQVNRGKLRDKFEPLDVHIYKLPE